MKVLKLITILITLSIFTSVSYSEEKVDCSQYSSSNAWDLLKKSKCKMDNREKGGFKKKLKKFFPNPLEKRKSDVNS
jgi:hypothetical protein